MTIRRRATTKRPAPRKPARRRNPAPALTPEERRQLERVTKMSEDFHGSKRGVIELDPAERKRLGYRFGCLVGYVDDIDYDVPRWSDRKGEWDHSSGDRGWWGKRSKRKMMLVVGPDGRHPQLVQNHSPMRLSTALGLMG